MTTPAAPPPEGVLVLVSIVSVPQHQGDLTTALPWSTAR